MNKLKSNDQHAPLQFISPYPQLACLDRLEQHFGDKDGDVSFNYVDDTATEFQIHYKQGSTPLIAYGSLKVWAAGEQTRIICRVTIDKATPTINNFMFEAVAAVVGFAVLFILIFLFVPVSSNEFPVALLCAGSLMVIGIFSGLASFFPELSIFVLLPSPLFMIFALLGLSPSGNSAQVKNEMSFMERLKRDGAKAESQFYDRLVALLSEPESA